MKGELRVFRELSRPVAAADAGDDDRVVFGREAHAPLFQREHGAPLVATNAPVRVRLGPERERRRDRTA